MKEDKSKKEGNYSANKKTALFIARQHKLRARCRNWTMIWGTPSLSAAWRAFRLVDRCAYLLAETSTGLLCSFRPGQNSTYQGKEEKGKKGKRKEDSYKPKTQGMAGITEGLAACHGMLCCVCCAVVCCRCGTYCTSAR